MRRIVAVVLAAGAFAAVPATSSATDPVRGVLVPGAGSPYSTGVTPYSVVTADFNNDGHADFATANTNGSSISVYLGDGAGGFTQPAGSPFTASHVAELRVGLVNGDAFPDLVTIRKDPDCCGNTDYLLTLLGNGDGTFATTLQGSVIGPKAGDGLVLGDFTGDGKLDAAYTNLTFVGGIQTQVFGVLPGNGNGTWGNSTEYADRASSLAPTGIVAGDVDGDGDLDLAVANTGTKDVTVWAQGPTGFALIGTPIPLARFTTDLLMQDVDGDGDKDLLVGNGSYQSLTVLLGDGAGHFSSASGSPLAIASDAYDVGSGDFDGDGIADVAVSAYDGKLRILLGDGAGHFAEGWGSPYDVTKTSDIAVADFTGDGHADVVRTNNTLDQAHVLLSAPDGVGPQTLISTNPDQPASGWFTGDVVAGVFASDTGPAGVANLRCVADPGSVPGSYADLPAGTCVGSLAVSGDGNHHVFGAAIDRAGNVGAVAAREILIDGTPPALSPTVEPATVVQGDPAIAQANATDASSGVATAPCDTPPTDVVGTFQVSCQAYDIAGNQASAQAAYTVIAPNAGITTAAHKAPGTRLGIDLTITSNTGLTVDDVAVALPTGLRYDAGPAGCTLDATTVHCPVGTVSPAAPVTVSLRVSPRSAGPHVVNATITPADGVATDNASTVTLGTGLVCDNTATAGNNTVIGTAGADILCGLDGDDTLRGLGGDDLMFGGAGTDAVSYAGSPAMWVDLRHQALGTYGAWPRSGATSGRDSFTGIENILGSSYADTLIGNGGANHLLGGAGADLVQGLAGVDRLEGGSGGDTLVGGTGTDTLIGGTGSDSCRERSDHRSGCER